MNPRPLPNTGAVTGVFEAISFFRDPDFAIDRFQRHGDVFETRLIGQQLVFIRGDRAIGDLLSQSSAVEGWWPNSVRQLLGMKSLANRNGADHKARRRVVGQLFSKTALADYAPSIITMVNDLVGELKQSPQPVALAQRMRGFAFDVIAKTVLGLDNQSRDDLFKDFEIWTQALFSIPIPILGTPFAKALSARERLLNRLSHLLQDRKESAQSTSGQRNGVDRLLGGVDENRDPLQDDDLAEQLLLLLFAGYETTASTLSCLMQSFLLDQTLNEWLQPELNQIQWPLIEHDLTNLEPESAPRLNALISEVMRLTPPVGGFFRRTREDITIAGIKIPEGRVIQVALAATNRLGPDDELERFRPQRHLDGSVQQILRPFGGGERVCLGQALAELEIRLMTVGLLKQLRLRLVPDQDLSLRMVPSPVPQDGLLVEADQEEVA